jgi:hypothetical protein
MTGERGFGERLAINRNVIAIVKEQFAERLVTIVGGIKVEVGFVEEYARKVFREGRLINSGIEMRIGRLLGESGWSQG